MKTGYLALASERRLLTVVLNDDLGSVQQAIGCQTIEHGTTFSTEDQLFIDPDRMDRSFTAIGAPFPFLGGHALLVGIDPVSGDIADQPVVSLDEFRRRIGFVIWYSPRVTVPQDVQDKANAGNVS